MTPHELITEARAHGVELWADGGALRYRGDREAVRAMLPTIRQHKPELVAALAGQAPALAGQAPALAVAVPAYHADPEPIAAAIRAGWTWHGGRWHRPGHWEATQAARPADPPPSPIPNPNPAAVPAVGGAGIRCADCRHHEPTQHAALVRCKAGREALAACGLWWAMDRRWCPAFALLVRPANLGFRDVLRNPADTGGMP